MSMLDSFFNKGFKGSKCKTLLKLTIPRIKLLRNRREIQLRQMRRDIAKLLETGQEATARIRVEHIIREENMMAAQEILELFCELIAVRLPIIEIQRECPLDLKEAISSVCFAAPRCADLTELLQVQMLFTAKYGKEFVSAATELMPDCGVNRQLIELLSVRAPSPEKKLKLLKEISEEHNLDWDPAATETEFNKSPEDLLNGSTQFVSASKLPLPKEKHDEMYNATPDLANAPELESDHELDGLDFPEVPKASVSLHPTMDAASPPTTVPPPSVSLRPETDHESSKYSHVHEVPPQNLHFEPDELLQERPISPNNEQMDIPAGVVEDKQFLPFITSPSLSTSFSPRQSDLPPSSLARTKSEVNANTDFILQDVLAAAQNAAETAERAAAAARSAASLAKVRIDELTKKKNDRDPETSCENPFHTDTTSVPVSKETSYLDSQDSLQHSSSLLYSTDPFEDQKVSFDSDRHLPEIQNLSFDSSFHKEPMSDHISISHQPQRLPSMDDDPYLSYPNLFTSQKSNHGSDQSSTGHS